MSKKTTSKKTTSKKTTSKPARKTPAPKKTAKKPATEREAVEIKSKKQARHLTDELGRTGILLTATAWEKRFGEEYSNTELIKWLVRELRIEMAEAEDMDPVRVAAILEADQRILSSCDHAILSGMPVNKIMSTDDIVKAGGYSLSTTSKRLQENMPLKWYGFIVKCPESNGFYRRE